MNCDKRSLLNKLNCSPLVSFSARKSILSSIYEETVLEKGARDKRRKHNCWFDEGFTWVRSTDASIRGIYEWVKLLNTILKVSRADSHPEKFSGTIQTINGSISASNIQIAAAKCLSKLYVNFSMLWELALLDGNMGESKWFLVFELVVLCGRCIKATQERSDHCLYLHHASEVELESDESETPICLCAPKLYFLIRPIEGLSTIISNDVAIKSMNMCLILLRYPNKVHNIKSLCVMLLDDILEPYMVRLFDDSTCLVEGSEASHCTFIDNTDQRLKPIVCLLWAKVLCCAYQNYSPQSNGERIYKGASASKLLSYWQNNDQWLLQGSFDLAKAFVYSQIHDSQLSTSGEPSKLRALTCVLRQALHPSLVFTQVCKSFCFDERLCLDLLLSNETNFLEYLITVLKISPLPSGTSCSHEKAGCLTDGDRTNEMLQRLKRGIVRAHEHDMFPYNPKPLLTRLDAYLSIDV